MDSVTKFLVLYFLPFISLLGLVELIRTIRAKNRMSKLRFISSSVVSIYTILFGILPYFCYNRLLPENFCNAMIFVLPISFFIVSLSLSLIKYRTRGGVR